MRTLALSTDNGKFVGVVALVIPVLLVAGTGVATAQTNDDNFGNLHWFYRIPNARAAAMGGAAVAASSPNTASVTNPAALVLGARPRSWKLPGTNASMQIGGYTELDLLYNDRSYVARGHAFGEPTGVGFDSISGLQTATDSASGIDADAFFYVATRSWGFGLHRWSMLNIEVQQQRDGVFTGSVAGTDLGRVLPSISRMKLGLNAYGGSFAVGLGDRISVGIGAGLLDFSIDSTTERFDLDPTNPLGLGGTFGPPDFGRLALVQRQSGSDTGVYVNAGILAELLDQVRVGVSGLWAGEMTYRATNATAGGNLVSDKTATFDPPDQISVGAEVDIVEQIVTAAVAYQWARYSDLVKGFQDIYGSEELQAVAGQYVAPNSNEVRGGVEVQIPIGLGGLKFWGGGRYKGGSVIRYDGPSDTQPFLAGRPQTVVFPSVDGSVHATGGLSVYYAYTLGGRRYYIEVENAVDVGFGTSSSQGARDRVEVQLGLHFAF